MAQSDYPQIICVVWIWYVQANTNNWSVFVYLWQRFAPESENSGRMIVAWVTVLILVPIFSEVLEVKQLSVVSEIVINRLKYVIWGVIRNWFKIKLNILKCNLFHVIERCSKWHNIQRYLCFVSFPLVISRRLSSIWLCEAYSKYFTDINSV
jgi:hypothetical protein